MDSIIWQKKWHRPARSLCLIIVLTTVFFNVGAQTITSISPISAAVGTTVTITGTGFNTTPANNIVFFGATQASVTVASATSLTTTVPLGATYAPVTVLDITTGLIASSLDNFTPTFTPNKSIESTDFETRVNFSVDDQSFAVVNSDIDGDGKADLVVQVNTFPTEISVFRNTSTPGTVGYAAKVDIATSGPTSISAGDLDGDGKPDLVLTNYDNDNVSVLRNTSSVGSIGFAASVDLATGTHPYSGAIGDLDEDGKLDLAIVNLSDNTVSVLLNTSTAGSISFAAKVDFATGANPRGVAISDLDGDSKVDLATANFSDNSISILRNTSTTGTPGFDTKIDYPINVGAGTHAIGVGDLDGDGKPDVIASNVSDNNVSVFRNISSAGLINFEPKVDLATGSGPYYVVIGDLNGDGKPDIATANANASTISVIKNNSNVGSISYANHIELAAGGLPYRLTTGDVDGDGKTDIIGSNSFPDRTVSVYRNNPVFMPFITTWSTTDGQITIPTTGGGYNYDVVWANQTNAGVGDGATTGATGDFTISGLTNGDIYQVEISGTFPRIYFAGNSESDKILTVEQWGTTAWTSMNDAFLGCSNLTIPATDAPDLSGVSDMSGMFQGASSLNQSLNGWDVTNVANMAQLFKNASSFNQPLNNWNVMNVMNMSLMFESASAFNQPLPWNVAKVTKMDGMFSLATAFNQNIGSWDVGMVDDMNNMFSGASSFDQDIGGWNVGNVTNMQTMFYSTPFNQDISGWNVSNVLNMREMFLDAGAFNQDLSAWVVRKVTDMRNMFEFATSFDQSLASWDISSITAMNGMLNNTNLSTANYDATIIGWATLSGGETLIPSTITLGASTLTYCAGEAARAGLIATNSWNFTGDSKNCPPEPEIALYQGTNNTGTLIPSGQVVPVHFGHLKLGQDQDLVFAIENTGTAALTINSITSGSTDFTVISPPATVAVGATENFTIRLSGATKGIYNAFISIDNNDTDEATYLFSLTGIVGHLDPKVYWTDDLAFPLEDQINRSDLDGNNFQQYYSGFEPKISGIAIDTTNNMVFWTSATKATLRCARLHEGGFTTYGTILDESGGSARAFNGLDIDASAQKIYFTSEWTNEIRRINFDGTGDQVLVNINGPKDIALDVAGGKMYYVVFNIGTPELWRANLDGSGQQMLYSSGSTLFLGVALDLVNGHVYWTESAGGIGRADLDGSNNTIVASANSPEGITINVNEQKIYYVDTSTPSIRRVNFDGTGDEAIQSGANVTNPVYIDIDPRFPPVMEPEINVYVGTDNTGTAITHAQATPIDIGSAEQGNDIVQTFAIENTGATDLNVSTISVSGTDYSVSSSITSVAVGTTETFTVTLSGTNAGTFNTTLDIASDDTDENPFTFDITGTISQPCLPITAGSSSVQSSIGVPTTVDVIAASTINNGDVITVSILQGPVKGTASIMADNTIEYNAATGTVGADSFTYQICNQCSLCSNGTVSIDILNEAPIFTSPSTPPKVIAGQTVTIELTSLFTDLNNNIDLTSFSEFSSTWNASPAYNQVTGTLVLDYANAMPIGKTDEISFTLCDQLGVCTNATLSIEVDGDITPYNGISPNGDGLNDYFVIQNIQLLEPRNKVTIYNRWGDKVFEMENYNSNISEKRFEGKQNNGKELPSGVYFYRLKFLSGRKDLTGYLTIKK